MKVEHRYMGKAPTFAEHVERLKLTIEETEFEIVKQLDGTISLRVNMPIGHVLTVFPHASNMIIIGAGNPSDLSRAMSTKRRREKP